MSRDPVSKGFKKYNYNNTFKTITRDQRQYLEDKLTLSIPVSTKYYPRDNKTKGRASPNMSIPKADLNRTRNFLLIPRFHDEYSSIVDPKQQQCEKFQLSQRKIQSQAKLLNKTHDYAPLMDKTITEGGGGGLDNTSTPGISNPPTHNNTTLKLSNLRSHSVNRQAKRSTLDILRDVNTGLIDFDRMPIKETFFATKATPQVNEKRFNYMSLPRLATNNKRVTGNIEFQRTTHRQELFPQRKQQPSYYEPNYEVILPKRNKSFIQMKVRRVYDTIHTIEPEDPNYFNYHMI